MFVIKFKIRYLEDFFMFFFLLFFFHFSSDHIHKFYYYFITLLGYIDFETINYIFVLFLFLLLYEHLINWSMILNFYEFSISIKGKRRTAWNRVRFDVRPCWQPCFLTRLLPNRHSDRIFLSFLLTFNFVTTFPSYLLLRSSSRTT